jgi:hypothetical protein
VGTAALCRTCRTLFCGISEESHVTSAFDGGCYLALMEGTSACYSSGEDFRALCHTAAKAGDVFIINVLNTIGAELTNFFAGFTVSSVVSFHCHVSHLLWYNLD